MRLDLARSVADAVLYEGYLLYPYRASSSKNRTRWQFGVLGPAGAQSRGLGEAPGMAMQGILAAPPADDTRLTVHLRFLQLQRREIRDADGTAVDALDDAAGTTWLTWDEAVEQELTFELTDRDLAGRVLSGHVDGGEEVEQLDGGTVVRRRWPLELELSIGCTPVGRRARLDVRVENRWPEAPDDTDDATRHSLIGTHVIIEAHGAEFVSLLDPPDDARELVDGLEQQRCWPVLGGEAGDTDLLLGLPIILYDYPEIAPESPGALFDATEIDEILTLRVMTMTDAEKAEARATDPKAREIIDRCDAMTPEAMQQMHGILRNPSPPRPDLRDLDPPTFTTEGAPWWDPAADAAVDPETDSVMIEGVPVSKGSLVRVHPNRRADAQDIFFADQVARVTSVLADVDGGTHVAVVLVDDPAAEMHDWYGRYYYFAPDELEPLAETTTREESRP